MTNTILRVAIFAAAALLAASTLVSAQCPGNVAPSRLCASAGSNGRCPLSYFRSQPLNDIKQIYMQCEDNGATCCTDICTLQASASACRGLVDPATGAPNCIYMPASDSSYTCVAKKKLCLLNSPSDCAKLPLCEMNNVTGTCLVRLTYSVAEIAGASINACPALHGIVIAMLVLMFLSLVTAVVIVAVVVVYKQRKADEEEKKAQEEAEAAEAAAKAQQQEEAEF